MPSYPEHTLYTREGQEHPDLLRRPAGIDDYLWRSILILGRLRRRRGLSLHTVILRDESGHNKVVQRDDGLRGCSEEERRDLGGQVDELRKAGQVRIYTPISFDVN